MNKTIIYENFPRNSSNTHIKRREVDGPHILGHIITNSMYAEHTNFFAGHNSAEHQVAC
jgi:hypothetical protein